MERLGRIAVDQYQATITFQDCSLEQECFRVILTLHKPRNAPAILKNRIEVWLLGTGAVPRDLSLVIHPPVKFLPEEAEEDTVKAVYGFRNDFSRTDLAAVVVAVDGIPKAFPIPQDTADIAPSVLATWKSAGAIFSSQGWYCNDEPPVPGFGVQKMELPPAQALPLPGVSFGLYCDNRSAGFLAKLPGLTQASVLWLHLERPLARADWKTLTGLQQLRGLSLSGKLEKAELQALTRLPQVQELSLSHKEANDALLKPMGLLKSLRSLSFGNANEVTDLGLQQLAPLRELRSLNLYYTKISDTGLQSLAGFQELRTLSLRFTRITDAGLKALANLTQLQTLDLSNTEITGVGLGELAGLQHLQHLTLYSTKVDDAALKGLANLTSLQTLNLGWTQITGSTFKELAGFHQLQTLDLSGNKLTVAGCRQLGYLKPLQNLNLNTTAITDAGLRGVGELNELRSLRLESSSLSGAGLKALAELQKLEDLYLFGSKLSNAGLKYLAGLRALRVLNLYNTGISDLGLKNLVPLKQLELLDVSGHSSKVVTAKGLAELRKALPWTYIRPCREE